MFETQRYISWLSEKIYLNSIAKKSTIRKVSRGQVYKCKFGVGIGSEEDKERPCVILQYDGGNRNSPNTIVAPITHTTSNLRVVVPIADKIDLAGNKILDGNVLLGNVVCVSKARLGDYITDLSDDEMKKVDHALSVSVGLYSRQKKLENQLADKLEYIEKLQKRILGLENEIKSMKSSNLKE